MFGCLVLQFQEPPNSENLANSSEEKVTGEAISSKKKEKKKHVDHVESSIFIAPGTVRSSDDLEDDAGDLRVLSRYVVTVSSPRGLAGVRCAVRFRGRGVAGLGLTAEETW